MPWTRYAASWDCSIPLYIIVLAPDPIGRFFMLLPSTDEISAKNVATHPVVWWRIHIQYVYLQIFDLYWCGEITLGL